MDVPYFLSKCNPDALRFYLTTVAPETRDTKARPEAPEGFVREDFAERNNPVRSISEGNEQVATRDRLADRTRNRGSCPGSFSFTEQGIALPGLLLE